MEKAQKMDNYVMDVSSVAFHITNKIVQQLLNR